MHVPNITPWIWLIIFGYPVVDTVLTNIIRAYTLPKWYVAHRSHAYQNLARCWGSHLKVLSLVLLIDIVWLLPLAVLAYFFPYYAWVYTLIAYCPLVVFVVKFGPLFSNE